MSRPWWVQRLFSRRSPRPTRLRQARPQLTHLEDRSTPATVTYTAVGGVLVFQGDAGEVDGVAVSTPAPSTLVITVTGGDTIVLAGDVAAGFTLSNGDATLTIDTALKPATDFQLLLGDKDDTLTVGIAATPSGVTNVTINGEADGDTVTLAGVAPDGFVSVTAETINLTGNVLTDGKAITFAGSVVIDGPAIAVDSEQGVNGDAGAIALGGPISAKTAGSTLIVDSTGLGVGKSGGAISYLGFDNAGGAFVTDLTLDSRGTLAAGVIALNGDIRVTGDTVANTASITVLGTAQVGASVSLVANDDKLNGGTVDLSGASVSATAAGKNLSIQASHTGGQAGKNGGSVTFGAFDAAGGANVNDVVVVADTGGAGAIRGPVSFAGNLAIDGVLTLTANDVTQAVGTSVTVAGAATFVLGAGSVTLDNAGNNFNSVAVTNGVNATFRDTGPIILGTTTVTGSLTVTAASSITQTGVISAPTGSFTATGAGSVVLSTSTNLISAVSGSASFFALTNGVGLTVTAAGISASTGIALEVQNTTAGQDLVVNGPLTATVGGISLTSGNGVTVSSSLTALTTIGVTIANGNASGRVADLSAATLTAPGGTSLLGGIGNDEFRVTATTTTVIDVDGGLPSVAPGDKLTIDAQGANTSDDGSTVTFVGFLPITYTEIETVDLQNKGAFTKIVNGTAAADSLILRQTAGVLEYSLNGAAFVSFVASRFEFNGLGGADTMTVDFSTETPALSSGIGYDGGAGGPDLLRVLGRSAIAGSYTPDSSVTGDGALTIDGIGISFANLTPIDVVTMGTFSVPLAGLADVITLTQSTLFGVALEAIRVEGSSGGVVIEALAVRDVGELIVDTTVVELAASPDTVTVNAITSAPLVANLTLVTAPDPATGTDLVEIAGAVSITGTLDITTNTTKLSANVTTGANQFYDAAAVVLTANVDTQSTSAGTIGFDGAVSGAFNLNVLTAGTGFFSSTVNLNALTTDAGGTTQVNGGGVTTSTTQTYGDAVVVGADATFASAGGSDINFNGTLNGAFNVAVNTVGVTTFGAAVGGAEKLASLTTDAGGTTRVNGGSIETTGTQTYKDAVTLAIDTLFSSTSGKDITFESTLDGPGAATVKTAGVTTFLGAVGNTIALAFLKTDAAGSVLVSGGLVQTTLDQLFNDGVTVAANTAFRSTGGGPISFVSTLGGAFDVTVFTDGTTTFSQTVDVNALTTDGGGSTVVSSPLVQTATTQVFNDPVSLLANVTFASSGGSDITFASTLDGSGGAAINTSGATKFQGTVGGITPLAFLSTNVGGTTIILPATVTTTGGQTYGDAVPLGGDVTFTSTNGGNIIFNGTLDGGGGAIVNTAGTTGFLGQVGGTTRLNFLITDAPGTTVIGGGLVKTEGEQTFRDGVTITADTTFTTTTNALTFESALAGAGKAAIFNSPGVTMFKGPVTLGSLVTDAAGQTDVRTPTVTTSGGQTYNDAVVLTTDVTFTSTLGGAVVFNSTVNGTGGAAVVTSGVTLFKGAVGGVAPVAFLRTDAAGVTVIEGGLVAATQEQVYLDGVVLSAPTVFTQPVGGNVTFQSALVGAAAVINTSGVTRFGEFVDVTSLRTDAGGLTELFATSVKTALEQSYGEPVVFGVRNVTLTSTGNSFIDFHATLDGPGGLTVPVGKLRVLGDVGSTRALEFITVQFDETHFNGRRVRTISDQTYFKFVGVHSDATFESLNFGSISFFESLASDGVFLVSVRTQGITSFGGAVSVGGLLTDVGGSTRFNGSTIQTVAFQSYNDAAFLLNTTQFVSTTQAVVFNSTLDGPGGLTSPSTIVFGGAVGATTPLAFLDARGTVIVSGGSVRTAGFQNFVSGLILNQPATLTSVGGGSVTLGRVRGLGQGLAVNTAGTTAFNDLVDLGSLETDAPGITLIGERSVTTAGTQTYRDGVLIAFGTTFTGGSVRFESALASDCRNVVVNSAGLTLFGGPVVDVGFLITDAPGTTTIAGGSVMTCNFQDYRDPVTIANHTTFAIHTTFPAFAGAGVRFGQTLTGPAFNADVVTRGETTFGGAVTVSVLSTDASGALGGPGTTTVTAGTITANQVFFGDPVTLGANLTINAKQVVNFDETLTGPFNLVLNSDGVFFRGNVAIGDLTSNGTGGVFVNSPLTFATNKFLFAGGVLLSSSQVTFIANQNSSFASGPFGATAAVTVKSPADVVFNGEVSVGSLTTDAGGRTVIRTARVGSTSDQTYGDAVVMQASGSLESAAGGIAFNGSLNSDPAGLHTVTVVARTSEIHFNGPVGTTGPLGNLAADAKTIRIASDVRVARDTLFTLQGGALLQTGGSLHTDTLGLAGHGTYRLEQAGNDIRVGVRANVGSEIFITDANDLSIDQSRGGIVTNNGDVFLTINGNFIFEDTRPEAEQRANPLINLGTGTLFINVTGPGPRTVVFIGEVIAAKVFLGIAGGQNAGADEFSVRPSATTPFFVFGNDPVGGVGGDSLLGLFNGLTITGFSFDGQTGFFDLGGRARITFSGIESIERLSIFGYVVQTTEPRDGTGSNVIESVIQVRANVGGQLVNEPLENPGFPENPFVVTPARVNPANSSSAPRIAFGDFNGDGRKDMAIANGPGTSPRVTVVDLAFIFTPRGTLPTVLPTSSVLAEFFAYDPSFTGGVNIAAGDLNGDGIAEIVTGADIGGGAHIRTFNLKAPSANLGTPFEAKEIRGPSGEMLPFSSFFAYEPTFRGGVRVAVGDVTGDGTGDLVYAAAADGGPRVTVREGKTGATLGDFFAYDPRFRGGVYIDAGDFNNDGKADILTGPGEGGGAHIRVFDGATVSVAKTPTILREFIAFDAALPTGTLVGNGGQFVGVGGVSFGAFDLSTRRTILVSTPRGIRTQVLSILTDSNPASPIVITNLTANSKFRVPNDPNSPIPPVVLTADQLTYGASVGAFAELSR